MPPPMITTRAWDGMLGTESPPATVHWIHRPPQAQPGYGSVLRDRLAQHRAHQVDIGAAGDEGRPHDRDIAGGLHVPAAVLAPGFPASRPGHNRQGPRRRG